MTHNLIVHGDTRSSADLIGEVTDEVKCFVMDPPYGANFQSRRAVTPEGKKKADAIAGDADLAQALALFNEVTDVVLPYAAQASELYVFTRWDIAGAWIDACRKLSRHGFTYKMMLVWDKGIPGMGDIDANWGCGHELILYCKKGRRDVAYRRSSIIHVDKVGAGQNIHETEKPAELIEKLIEMSTDRGDWVVDPFSGSGSTAVAAQRLGRNSISFERNEKYIEPSRRRLEQRVFAL